MSEKVLIAPYGLEKPSRKRRSLSKRLLLPLLFVAGALLFTQATWLPTINSSSVNIPFHAEETLQKCKYLHTLPGPPPDFNLRNESDRFVLGTRATLIKNATIWTGRAKGLEVVNGDLLLDGGIIKAVGKVESHLLPDDFVTYDANGAWVSPG